jgi:hypothetical protein
MGEKIVLFVMIVLFLIWIYEYENDDLYSPAPGHVYGLADTFPLSPERVSDMRGLANRLKKNGYSDAGEALDQTVMTAYVNEDLHAQYSCILRELLAEIPIEEWDYINGGMNNQTVNYADE